MVTGCAEHGGWGGRQGGAAQTRGAEDPACPAQEEEDGWEGPAVPGDFHWGRSRLFPARPRVPKGTPSSLEALQIPAQPFTVF